MRPKRIKKQTKKIEPIQVNQLEVLNDRSKLREYAIQNSIKTPDFFVSDDFNKISLWAMKKNIFPLCLKSSKNLSDASLFYILKAFRELPEFFEKIQSKTDKDKVIIEEFIEGKAYIEVTLLNGKVKFISQLGLNKAMRLQQKWRAFPLKLPESIFTKVLNIINKFDKLIESLTEPIRFSFVIKNSEPILLSINSDYNRLEYKDEWRKQAGLDSLTDTVYPSSTNNINKINIYKLPKEFNQNLDLSNLENICEKSKVKYEIIDNKLYFMLTSKNSKDLAEDFEKANAIINQELLKDII